MNRFRSVYIFVYIELKEQQRAEKERLKQEAHLLEIKVAEKDAEDKMKANQHAK